MGWVVMGWEDGVRLDWVVSEDGIGKDEMEW